MRFQTICYCFRSLCFCERLGASKAQGLTTPARDGAFLDMFEARRAQNIFIAAIVRPGAC